MAHWTPPHFYQRVFKALPSEVQADGRVDWLHPRLSELHKSMLPVAAKRMRRIQAARSDLAPSVDTPARNDVIDFPPEMLLRLNPIFLTNSAGEPLPYGNVTAQCAGCGTWKHPAVHVDVRTLDNELTGGQAFACDGCWNGWILQGRTVGGEKLSRRLWIELHGAPQEFLDRVDALPANNARGWTWTRPDWDGRAMRYPEKDRGKRYTE